MKNYNRKKIRLNLQVIFNFLEAEKMPDPGVTQSGECGLADSLPNHSEGEDESRGNR